MNRSRREFMKLAGAFGVSAFAGTNYMLEAAGERLPNIIYIFADDLGHAGDLCRDCRSAAA